MSVAAPKAVVELAAADLQGPGIVFCPNPKMPLWNHHPRVFIDVGTAGEGRFEFITDDDVAFSNELWDET